MTPVVVSKQSNTTFSDKSQVWADNAAVQSLLRQRVHLLGEVPGPGEKRQHRPGCAPGGRLPRRRHHMDAAPDLGRRQQRPAQPPRRLHHPHRQPGQRLRLRHRIRSVRRRAVLRADVGVPQRRRDLVGPDAGRRPRPSAGDLRHVQGSPTIDGIAGARSDLAPAPSVDIANGAPTGTGATNHMVMSFVSSQATADENPSRLLRGVQRSWRQLDSSPADRGPGGPRLLHGARHLARRLNCLCRLQRLHHAVPDRQQQATRPRGRGHAGNRECRRDGVVDDPQPRRHR